MAKSIEPRSVWMRSRIRQAFWVALAIGIVTLLGRAVGYLMGRTTELWGPGWLNPFD